MQSQTVSSNIFKTATQSIECVFGVKETKSIDGVVMTITSLFLAKKYGEECTLLSCTLPDQDDPSLYKNENILESIDDAIIMALNSIV